MKTWRRRGIISSGPAALALLCGIWWMPAITVVNESGGPVHDVLIMVDSGTYDVGSLWDSGESRSIRVMIEHDTSIRVYGRSADGTTIDSEGGHMAKWKTTPHQRATVTIGPGGTVTIK